MSVNHRPGHPLPGMGKEHPNAEAVREGQRPCPICAHVMATRKEGAITVDVCEDHGIWLDKGELEAVRSAARDFQRRRDESSARAASRDSWADTLFPFLGGLFDLFPHR